MARLLALDVGTVRIGVAICDPSGILASPYTTLQVTRDEQQIWTALQQIIADTEAEGIVIGLPISLDGQIHAQGQWVQAFAERLRTQISLPIVFWDERLSTFEANRLRAEQGGRDSERKQRRSSPQRAKGKRRRRGHEIDALAATVILQDYLDHHQGSTTRERQE